MTREEDEFDAAPRIVKGLRERGVLSCEFTDGTLPMTPDDIRESAETGGELQFTVREGAEEVGFSAVVSAGLNQRGDVGDADDFQCEWNRAVEADETIREQDRLIERLRPDGVDPEGFEEAFRDELLGVALQDLEAEFDALEEVVREERTHAPAM